MNLSELIDRYNDAITRAVLRTYPPVYDAEARRSCGFDLRRLLAGLLAPRPMPFALLPSPSSRYVPPTWSGRWRWAS